ncbi:MAG: hypothetical protein KDA62_14955 [Planctomycetales bacterium]|nr:hypothetical protein [Planctomycetales bacterium]
MPDLMQSFSWQTAQEIAADLVTDHWLKILCGVLLAVGGAVLAKWKQRRNYHRRQFLERTNLSLNFIEDNTLRIRTLFEVNLPEIIFNDTAREMVLQAARRTTIADPFLRFATHHDAWFVNNSVLNEISERFLDGFVAHDAGLPTELLTYVLGVTCERDGDVRVQKLRVMLAREPMLLAIASGAIQEPEYERPYHHVRWKTLKTMASIYKQQRESSQPDEGRLMRAEIRLRLSRNEDTDSSPMAEPQLNAAVDELKPAPLASDT